MSYNRDDVLSAEQVRKALGIGQTTWRTVRHRLPWSYVFGQNLPRITWGQVVDLLETPDVLATKRRKSA